MNAGISHEGLGGDEKENEPNEKNESTAKMKKDKIEDNTSECQFLEKYWREGVGGLQVQHPDDE